MDHTRIQPNIVDSADLLRHVTADKAPLYRAIMDAFAAAKRQYRLQLRPDEVASEADWPGDTPRIEEINALLAQLSQWGNLESQPDTARVSTLSDFYRARFLYRLSHGGEAVETGLARSRSAKPGMLLLAMRAISRIERSNDGAPGKNVGKDFAGGSWPLVQSRLKQSC